jgi:hypothetical protein
VSNFAFLLKNRVRQRGLQRIVGGVHLTGTGMAFPWPIFREAELATSNIVEDLNLGLSLWAKGQAPLLHHEAKVWSAASNPGGTIAQRTRWEGGFLATAREFALPLIGRSFVNADARRLWLGMNLLIPPLALLAVLNLVAAVTNVAAISMGGEHGPLLLLALSIGSLVIGVAVSWFSVGRDFLAVKSLLLIPIYVAWKLPMYVRIAAGRPSTWLRSGR